MSTQLIPLFNGIINQEEIKLVNAQLLHSFLEVETRFNDWINRRIEEYQFIENTDFILITQKRVTKGRGGDRRSKDYHLTLDMAKELAMIERTDKGRQARKYFIECEKQLMEILFPNTISIEQQQLIKQAVNERSYRTGEHYQAIYTKLYEYFKIPRYQDLPASKFDDAIKFLGGVNVKNGLSDEDLYDLAWLFKAADRMRYQIELIAPALNTLGSSFSGSFYTMAQEYRYILKCAKPILERETAHISDKGLTNKWNNVLPMLRGKPRAQAINFQADIAYLD